MTQMRTCIFLGSLYTNSVHICFSMIDIKILRTNPDIVRKALHDKVVT